MVGRSVQLEQASIHHPRRGAAWSSSGTFLFFAPDFFMPIVNEEQIGGDEPEHRGRPHAIFRRWDT